MPPDLFYCLIVMDMTLGLIISYRVSVEKLWQWLRILWWSDSLSIQSICRWTGLRRDRIIPPGSENCSFSIQASRLLTHTWVDICSFKNICKGHYESSSQNHAWFSVLPFDFWSSYEHLLLFFHSVSGKVSAHKLVRVFAALCVLCLLGGVVIGVWFIGKKLNYWKALVIYCVIKGNISPVNI